MSITPAHLLALPQLAPISDATDPIIAVTQDVLDVVARLLDVRVVAVARIESTNYTIMCACDREHLLGSGLVYRLDDTCCAAMLQAGTPLVIPDLGLEAPALQDMPLLSDLGVQSYLGVPIQLNDARVFGSLWIADNHPRAFTAEDITLLELFARLLTPHLAQHLQTRHLERIDQMTALYSSVDPLTGLIAPDMFESLVQREVLRADRYGNPYAIAVLSLDGCEHVAARHGAQGVNSLQLGLADILMRTSRLIDSCARIDDCTFAVLFPETVHAGVEAWQTRISQSIAGWNRIHAPHQLLMNVAVGIADSQEGNRHLFLRSVLDVARRRAADDGIHRMIGEPVAV